MRYALKIHDRVFDCRYKLSLVDFIGVMAPRNVHFIVDVYLYRNTVALLCPSSGTLLDSLATQHDILIVCVILSVSVLKRDGTTLFGTELHRQKTGVILFKNAILLK